MEQCAYSMQSKKRDDNENNVIRTVFDRCLSEPVFEDNLETVEIQKRLNEQRVKKMSMS